MLQTLPCAFRQLRHSLGFALAAILILALGIAAKFVSDELLQIEEGSSYSALQRMLKAGWLESEMGLSVRNRPVRIFKETAAGNQHLKQEISSFEKMFAGITRVLAVAQS